MQRRDQPLKNMDSDIIARLVTARTMAHIRLIIRDLVVPGWYDKPPSRYGAKSAGTLTAAQWTSMIQLYLPIALATLWHPASPLRDVDAPAHAPAAFDNVMHLTQASIISYKDNMSEDRANQYRQHYAKWVETLTSERLACYGEKLVPNVHAGFHIYETLRDIGPARVTHCLPFERLIGRLQRQNTNHKTGAMLMWYFSIHSLMS